MAEFRRCRSTIRFRDYRMTTAQRQKDLFVLVADLDMLQTMETLLNHSTSLGISAIDYDVARHLQRDPGCRVDASRYLRHHINQYRYALVMFDREGCGHDARREAIQEEVEEDLARNGWRDRSKVIVIDPELEAWVWSNSRGVPEVLGWRADYVGLRNWLESRHLWPRNSPKPPEPKKAMLAAMRHQRVNRSSRKFSALASRVAVDGTLSNCQDVALNELRDTLRLWFTAARP